MITYRATFNIYMYILQCAYQLHYRRSAFGMDLVLNHSEVLPWVSIYLFMYDMVRMCAQCYMFFLTHLFLVRINSTYNDIVKCLLSIYIKWEYVEEKWRSWNSILRCQNQKKTCNIHRCEMQIYQLHSIWYPCTNTTQFTYLAHIFEQCFLFFQA